MPKPSLRCPSAFALKSILCRLSCHRQVQGPCPSLCFVVLRNIEEAVGDEKCGEMRSVVTCVFRLSKNWLPRCANSSPAVFPFSNFSH